MKVYQEQRFCSPSQRIFLSHESLKPSPSPLWCRAFTWHEKLYLCEGFPPAENTPLSLIIFSPENETELLSVLIDTFFLQKGKEEIEWLSLALYAIDFGIPQSVVEDALSSYTHLPIHAPFLWNWGLHHKELIQQGIAYGIPLRVLFSFREDTEWLSWLSSALPLLQPNGNQLKQIYQGFQSLRIRYQWNIATILEKLEWENIVSIKQGPVKLLETLLIRLKKLRYPHLTTTENELSTLQQAILKTTGWRLSWPPFLEGESITLTLSIQKPIDIESLPSHLSQITPYLQKALTILRGEKL